MSSPHTLNYRVTWAIAATVALSVGLMALLAYSIMYEQEDELADQLVQIEMHRLIERLDRRELLPAKDALELGPAIRAWVGPGADFGSDAYAPQLQSLPNGPHELETSMVVLHVLVADSSYGRIVVVFDATANERRVAQFGFVLFLLWAGCSAMGIWLAKFIARIVTAPIRDVTERIASWDPEVKAVGTDADPRPGGDEPSRLQEAFNRMQDRVDRSIGRQREFAANLSHEVRTPLAALRSDIEMMALDHHGDEAGAARLARMLDTIDDVGATISAARQLSQTQTESRQQVVDLDVVVAEVWASLRSRGESAGLQFENRVPLGQRLRLDRYALLVVLRNLIGNAIEHAAPAVLVATCPGATLQLADDGPGIDAAALPFVFDRYHRGRLSDQEPDVEVGDREPRGLGLAIARRVCQQQHWLLTVESATSGPGRGTVFFLQFDETST